MWAVQKIVDGLALAYAVVEFPVPLYWLILHPGIGYWRRIGYRAFWLALPLWSVSGAVLTLSRHLIFSHRMPRDAWSAAGGVALLALAGWMEWNVHHTLHITKLAGLPEVNPGHALRGVVSSGIYSRLRHPRYVHLVLGFLGFALLTGALGIFLLAIFSALLYLVVAPLEERELRERLGAEYEAYCREVPRFVPRLGRKMENSPLSGGGFHA